MIAGVKKNFIMPLVLMLVLAISRWPGIMPANFSAVYAVMFCAGVYFSGRLAWMLPLGTMLVCDIVFSFFVYSSDQGSVLKFIITMAPSYLGWVILIAVGRWLKGGKQSWITLVSGGIVGALLFYIVTNTLAWLSMPQYQKTLLGWLQALTGGLPGYPPTWEFFRNTLMSGGLFSGLFVGAFNLVESSESAEEKREPAPEAAEPEPEEAKG